MTLPLYDPGVLVARVRRVLVGLEREAEVLSVALSTGRHLVLEGPPGTGKSTLLRAIADEAGVGLEFVEGNAELTPSRLVGYHDPAMVLQGGYRPEAFVPGPLVEALTEGRLLYIEELNRVPEESLNVLITALAEGELHVPRVGRIEASQGFRLVAAMNPYDAIGTARIGQAIYDRMCRISIGYQDEQHEREIVARVGGSTRGVGVEGVGVGGVGVEGVGVEGVGVDDPDIELAVALGRATRSHPDVRVGSSVRGAIDMVLMVRGLRQLRGIEAPSAAAPLGLVTQRQVLLDGALAAFSGRIRLDEACDRLPEEVVAEILDRLLREHIRRHGEPDEDGGGGKADRPGSRALSERGRGEMLSGEEARKAVIEAGRRTHGRAELAQRHDRFDDVSPETGVLDEMSLDDLLGDDPDAAAALLADMANAIDSDLRRQARRAALRLFIRLARDGRPAKRGVRRLASEPDRWAGDLDLDATLARTGGLRPTRAEQLVSRVWRADDRAICLLIDRSGSMSGKGVATAAVAAAAVLMAAGERADCSVVAFAKHAIVLQEQGKRRPTDELVGDVLTLRGHGVTDMGLALRTAGRQLARSGNRERVAVLLSDAIATTGIDPVDALRGLDRLHVLGTSADPESVAMGRLLARRGNGRYRLCESVSSVSPALRVLLDG